MGFIQKAKSVVFPIVPCCMAFVGNNDRYSLPITGN